MGSEEIDKTKSYARTRGSNMMDIADRENMEHMITMQRDLGLALDRASSLQESLQLCLDAALNVSGLDAGGIYMLDQVTGDLNLISTVGVSGNFTTIAGKSSAGSKRTKMVLAGHPIYLNQQAIQEMRSEEIANENISSVAMIPFGNKGQIIGCLNVASRIFHDIPARSRSALETIALQIGSAVMRAQLEQSLRQSEEKYRMIVENMRDVVWVMDFNLRYKYRSPSNFQITGYTSEEIMNRPAREQIVPESYALAEKILAEELADEFAGKPVDSHRSRTMELEVYHKNGGTVWIEVTGSFIRDKNGKPVEILLAGRNITERKNIEKEKNNLQKQLVQSHKMEAIGTLAGGIVHDFNNILASMMGFTEMAVNEPRKAIRQTYLHEVLQASERAKSLINQILTFSRQREQESHPVDIRLVIKEALTLLRATLPTTIDMQQNITVEPTVVLADPTQIHQIAMNLCTNAAQAMTGKKGLLEIHLSNISIVAPGLASHPDLQPGPYVQLSVRDNGCGIDPAIRDRIFDPFVTTNKASGGTGLGLSVVYGIVKSCGGGIDIQSDAGRGATFTIYLPRIPVEEPFEEENQEDVDLKGDERILFVDDEAMLVKMAKNYFQQLGYQITATTSSPEALRLFQEHPEAFDLVITDMTMPQITGADLSRELLKIHPELPIILCTGYSDSMIMDEARKLNIRDFVPKPILLKDLCLQVRRILDGKTRKGLDHVQNINY